MDIKIKKVSELDNINPLLVNDTDIMYFVRNNDQVYESLYSQFNETFLSTTYIDRTWFCSDTLKITEKYFDIIANTVVDGSIVMDGIVNTNTGTIDIGTIQTSIANELTCTVNAIFPNSDITANTISLYSFTTTANTITIANSTSIDCGINRVKNVSDPVENLDALNLLYFNEHVFNCTGALVTFPTNNEPRGWLASNGQTVSRSTYQDLWQFANSSGYLASSEATKTNVEFGPGNGSTTFSLPNISCCGGHGNANTNIMFVVDVSGSMQGEKLANAKTAAKNLISGYANTTPNIKVLFIEFSTTTNSSIWMNYNNANTYIDNIPTIDMLNTHYDLALSTAISDFNSNGTKLTGNVKNVCYFLSDGNPVPSQTIPTDAEKTNWLNFLRTNKINSYAIGIGSSVSLTYLNPIAYDGSTSNDRNAQIVVTPNNLSNTLFTTIQTSTRALPTFIKT